MPYEYQTSPRVDALRSDPVVCRRGSKQQRLSDVYEFIYFGGPTAPFADPEGDRVTTYDEMFWGTNPTSATSKVTNPTATQLREAFQSIARPHPLK